MKATTKHVICIVVFAIGAIAGLLAFVVGGSGIAGVAGIGSAIYLAVEIRALRRSYKSRTEQVKETQ